MWLIEIEDDPTMTPGKAIIKIVKSLWPTSGLYKFRNVEGSFSFTRNGDKRLLSASIGSIGNKVAISCLSHSRTQC